MRKKIDIIKNSGITLMSLIITIVVLLILAGVATYSGIEAIENTKYTKFVAELKIMQTYVNEWYEDLKDGENKLETAGAKTVLGNDLDANIKEQAIYALGEAGISPNDYVNYYFVDNAIKEELEVEGVTQSLLVSIENRQVVSYLGLNHNDNMYYTLKQLNEFYNVDYKDKNESVQAPTFSVNAEDIGNGKARITISQINYEGYNEKWEVKYRLKNSADAWSTSSNLSFIVTKSGEYDIRLFNPYMSVAEGVGTVTVDIQLDDF